MHEARRYEGWHPIAAACVVLLASALLLVGCAGSPTPAGRSVGPLTVDDIYARPAPAGGIGGAFLTVRNAGQTPDRLVGARTSVAQAVELHETIEENGVMKMRPVAGGFEVPAGGKLELKPGGGHMMFVGLSSALKQGEQIEITLSFEKAGDITLNVPVHQ